MVQVTSFIKGLNAWLDPIKVPELEQYPLLINGRNRDGSIAPILRPSLLDLPAGKYQGIYSARNYSIVFISGLAYYRDFSVPNSPYNQIAGFQLDANVDVIYAWLVPNSSSNFGRQAVSNIDASAGIKLSNPTTGSPACLLCQDGINQPWIIEPNGAARVTQTWEQWSQDAREYVPIGTMMVYQGAILYLVSADGTKLLRSVSGRPLDFMVVISTNGDKLPGQDAYSVSHAVSFDTIKAINPVPSEFQDIYLSTGNNSYFVRPDFSNTVFNEPTFKNIPLFETGSNNPFSLIQLLGDIKLIDTGGLRSFNSVMQTQRESNNTPFSKEVTKFFSRDVVQGFTCAKKFDDLGYFAVQTVYGPGVLIYDELTEQFVGLDLYKDLTQIKMFSEVKVGTVRKLLFITTDNKAYEFGGGTSYETCSVYVGDFPCANGSQEQSVNKIHLIFTRVLGPGIVSASVYVDGKVTEQRRSFVNKTETIDVAPISLPFGDSSEKNLQTATMNTTAFREGGYKFGTFIQWNFGARLSTVTMENDVSDMDVKSDEQAEKMYAVKDGIVELESFNPPQGPVTAIVTITGMNLQLVSRVYVGVIECQILTKNASELTFVVANTAVTDQISVVYNGEVANFQTDFTVL